MSNKKLKNLSDEFMSWAYDSGYEEGLEEMILERDPDDYTYFFWESYPDLDSLDLDGELDELVCDMLDKGWSRQAVYEALQASSESIFDDIYTPNLCLYASPLGEMEESCLVPRADIDKWLKSRGVTIQDLEKALGWQHQNTCDEFFEFLTYVNMDYHCAYLVVNEDKLEAWKDENKTDTVRNREQLDNEKRAEAAHQALLEERHAVSQSGNVFSLCDYRRFKGVA